MYLYFGITSDPQSSQTLVSEPYLWQKWSRIMVSDWPHDGIILILHWMTIESTPHSSLHGVKLVHANMTIGTVSDSRYCSLNPTIFSWLYLWIVALLIHRGGGCGFTFSWSLWGNVPEVGMVARKTAYGYTSEYGVCLLRSDWTHNRGTGALFYLIN